MKYKIVSPAMHEARIVLPTSKSISNRLLLLSAICGGGRMPDALSDCDDTAVMLAALKSDLSHVDVGAAGTSMRFLSAFLATKPGEHVITGSARMKQRPIAILVDALRELGAHIEYVENEGFPPLRIFGGGLKGGSISLPGDVSSQYISALMMIGPTLPGGLTINLLGEIISRPYIEMTRVLMKDFGVETVWNGNVIEVPQANYVYKQMRVEGDWSAASYWYAISSLTPGVAFDLVGLVQSNLQGDAACAKIAEAAGVETSFGESGARIVCKNPLKPAKFEYDFSCQPDLAQTFVVMMCICGIPFKVNGLKTLKIKETDRITALVVELAKLGFKLTTNDVDTIEWNGDRLPNPSMEPIKTYKDHRMAMAFTVAARRCDEFNLVIDEPEVVSKSYPKFWDDIKSVGFHIEVIN